MHVIEPMGGDDIYHVLEEAVQKAPARFKFNEWEFATRAGETLGDARQRFEQEHGFKVLTPEESSENALRALEDMQKKHAAAIAEAGAATEQQLRETEAPNPRTIEELSTYIEAMVTRPHDYGTCVYAMSLSATAAFNYVAHKLGVTGFQASCADMDVIKRTRHMKQGFRIIDYQDLLYPQYEEKIPGFWDYIKESKEHLANEARKMLADKSEKCHPDVRRHWERIAKMSPA